ncbi:lipase class 3 family protein [Quillaja saponaria]|uniref:Lipase class 3 family protein n=1 Tax=Quillaja saponaria TaxID=32244 RepID=A0AAD7PMV8_QUISA|nr:lipase class 3 family protein [Quillaja saponaria]
MEFIQGRVEPWIRDQRNRLMKVSWGPLQWRMRWPWSNERERRKKMQEEYELRRKQLEHLCIAVKAESVSDLQDILCCMVLSECVYKRPVSEMVRAVNKFKADFGGQVVSLERVQPSSDHVPHRYLLAEDEDTLFASFIGTKQYKDIMVDANILQGAIFHEDAVELPDGAETTKSPHIEAQSGKVDNSLNSLGSRSKQLREKSKPAVHRGFLARAKGIPALELYRLAQKKKRKLVLCGHSLGGAVATLATLAILRVIAASSPSRENEKVSVKCITFSQPPVGNAALKDYVNKKGWQHYFKSYCIPEDLVPSNSISSLFSSLQCTASTSAF